MSDQDWGAPSSPETHQTPYMQRMDATLGISAATDAWKNEWETQTPAPAIMEADRPRLTGKLARRIGAATLGVVLAGGAVLGVVNAVSGGEDAPTSTSSSSNGGEQAPSPSKFDAFEQPATLDPTVASDFEKAIEADTCTTSVTVSEVSKVYTEIFGERTLPASGDQLSAQTKASVERLQEAKDKLTFSALTPEQSAFLEAEEAADYSGSYDAYKNVLEGYLAQQGIKLTDTWDNETNIGATLDGSRLNGFIEPMSSAELAESKSIKFQIAQTIKSLSLIPQEVIEQSTLSEVLIGNIVNKDAVAAAPMGTDILILDANNPSIQTTEAATSLLAPTTISHEVSHLLDSGICLSIFGNYVNDLGYTSLNRDFTYSAANAETLNAGEPVDGKYTTIGSDTPGEAVVNRGYGAINEQEDRGTLLGETVLYTPGSERIFRSVDGTIVEEKVSLLIARIGVKNPAAAEYYTQVLQTAQVLDAAREMLSPLETERFDLYAELYGQGIEDPTTEPEYQAMTEKIQPYEDVVAQLEQVLEGSSK